jgi:hypothetical protein
VRHGLRRHPPPHRRRRLLPVDRSEPPSRQDPPAGQPRPGYLIRLVTAGDPNVREGVAANTKPRSAEPPLGWPWIWAGLALALIGRFLAANRPGRTPDLTILALFVLPYTILACAAFRLDTGRASVWRGLRAALFAFLAIEAFYFGVSLGGLAAAAGAFVIFTRFIRPRVPKTPE